MKYRPNQPPGAQHSNDDLPVQQVMEEILETFENIPQERVSERTQIVDVPVPEILENIPQERISERVHEQIVDVPVPHGAQPVDQPRPRRLHTSTRLSTCLW